MYLRVVILRNHVSVVCHMTFWHVTLRDFVAAVMSFLCYIFNTSVMYLRVENKFKQSRKKWVRWCILFQNIAAVVILLELTVISFIPVISSLAPCTALYYRFNSIAFNSIAFTSTVFSFNLVIYIRVKYYFSHPHQKRVLYLIRFQRTVIHIGILFSFIATTSFCRSTSLINLYNWKWWSTQRQNVWWWRWTTEWALYTI